MIPRQVELQYAGIKSDGTSLMKISFGTKQEETDDDGVTHVILENTSPNAKLDYATGMRNHYLLRRKLKLLLLRQK